MDCYKEDPQLFDFGGYFSIESFGGDIGAAIRQLFVHALDKLALLKGDADSCHLLTGDDLACACYNSTRGFEWTDRHYFRYARVSE